jgi:hypothetical protein
LKELKKKGNER